MPILNTQFLDKTYIFTKSDLKSKLVSLLLLMIKTKLGTCFILVKKITKKKRICCTGMNSTLQLLTFIVSYLI